ncbi:MAG: imidazole glycerol phosphate synthase subunit HisF [Alphaproteobacteria bacterium]|nr:imidazole glycerol phosphate synthase subunit HisF [Alphaproteobacteria bacterium]
MLKTRVIPILLIKDGGLNKPFRFTRPRTVANPMSIARVFEERKVDELVLLDIGCAGYDEAINEDFVRRIADELTVPFAVGGGVKDVETMKRLIAAGAEKVVINTAAVEVHGLIEAGAALLGRQAIVVSIDALRHPDRRYEVFTRNGKHPTGLEPAAWAREAERRGAGEIIICAMHQDGAMEGYDIDLTRGVADAVSIPVIAAGGAGRVEDFVAAAVDGHASAVAAGSIFHFRHVTPNMAKEALRQAGVPVRRSYIPGT